MNTLTPAIYNFGCISSFHYLVVLLNRLFHYSLQDHPTVSCVFVIHDFIHLISASRKHPPYLFNLSIPWAFFTAHLKPAS